MKIMGHALNCEEPWRLFKHAKNSDLAGSRRFFERTSKEILIFRVIIRLLKNQRNYEVTIKPHDIINEENMI